MHHLLLITLTMPAGATSHDARNLAHSMLCEDDSFCGDGGRFGSRLCDWFVIGGRWSGLLEQNLFGQPYQDAFEAEFPKFALETYTHGLIDEHRDGLNQFWRRFGGRDSHPLVRTGYEELGFDDDAKLIDRATYEHFLKPYEGEDFGGNAEFVDLEGEAAGESFVGRKWLVVVDYHN